MTNNTCFCRDSCKSVAIRGMSDNKNRTREEFNRILEALKEYPNGASADEILEASGLSMEMHSLQRRLSKLLLTAI